MAGLDCDERSPARRGYFIVRNQLTLYHGAILKQLNRTGDQANRLVGRRRTQKFDRVIGSDRARWVVCTGLLHQKIRRRPVTVTIQQRSDYSTTQHAGERLVFRLGLPFSDYNFAIWKAANVQTLFVRRTATETGEARRISLLDTLFSHEFMVRQTPSRRVMRTWRPACLICKRATQSAPTNYR